MICLRISGHICAKLAISYLKVGEQQTKKCRKQLINYVFFDISKQFFWTQIISCVGAAWVCWGGWLDLLQWLPGFARVVASVCGGMLPWFAGIAAWVC